jgi:two-component system chemotaxis response regulator CheB
MQNKEAINTKSPTSRAVVIGTSAGGLDVLTKLLSQLESNFPAPVLVVQHISAEATGDVLLETLNRLGTLKCEHAKTGTKLKPGHLYLAPPDHHLMLDGDTKILITKGAQENRFRPAIDPLFRSAGIEFGTRLIGVVLSGYLDDGTSGMKVIQRCGGICVVQDPVDAQYPDMPKNVLNQLKVDHCVPVSEMGSLLYRLLEQKPKKQKAIPKDILIEAEIAKHVLSDLPSVNALGEQVPFNCPVAAVCYGKLITTAPSATVVILVMHIPQPRCLPSRPKRLRKQCGWRFGCLRKERIC